MRLLHATNCTLLWSLCVSQQAMCYKVSSTSICVPGVFHCTKLTGSLIFYEGWQKTDRSDSVYPALTNMIVSLSLDKSHNKTVKGLSPSPESDHEICLDRACFSSSAVVVLVPLLLLKESVISGMITDALRERFHIHLHMSCFPYFGHSSHKLEGLPVEETGHFLHSTILHTYTPAHTCLQPLLSKKSDRACWALGCNFGK